MDVITIETPSLGDRSYIVHDGQVGLVIDPQRDIDRVVVAAHDAGIDITHIAETHVHNDYVSGGLTLSGSRERSTCTPPTSPCASTTGAFGTETASKSAGCTCRYAPPPGTPRTTSRTSSPPTTIHPLCSPEARCCTERSGEPTDRAGADRAPHPRAVPLRARSGRLAARRRVDPSHARLRKLLCVGVERRRFRRPPRNRTSGQHRTDG